MHAYFETICSGGNANTCAESWIGSLKRECLDHFLCFHCKHLDHILCEYRRFHNRYRPQQDLDNQTLPAAVNSDLAPDRQVETDPIGCRRLLDGLLRHYYRAAA